MFSTLESTWDNSARRGWTTLASFTMQALALSLLLVISLIWVAPPQVRWLQLSTPATFSPQTQTAAQAVRPHHAMPVTIARPEIVAPTSIPLYTQTVNDPSTHDANSDSSAPDLPIGSGTRGTGNVQDSFGNYSVAIPPRPVPVKPLLVSHLSEANLLHEVKPVYPPLARQARIQGAVELRAIISKSGTIENLVVVRGHPMLSAAAIEAVRQWRYRPYVLNGEPIEVETEITVNFLLSGG
jgi:periplasmic protein TonB